MKTKTEKTSEARWTAIEAMSAEDFEEVQARVTICLDCLGPALLSDDELGMVACTPRCRRCRQEVAA